MTRFILATVATTVLAMACATAPVTGRKQLRLLPESQMNTMGVQAYSEMLSKEKISSDKRLTDMVVRVGNRIAAASGKDYKWEFKLIDDPKTLNAFCLPGGKVAVYTGILPIAKNEAGLAAIMGHEVAHAVLQHGNERVSQGVLAQAGLTLAAVSMKDNKYRNLIVGGLGVGTQFGVMLPFSRKHETEADVVGAEYMAKAGYDPRESVEVWKRMAAQGGKMPEVLSTHPDPLRRAKELEQLQGKLQPIYAASSKQPNENF